jgi:hypothetical protein
MVQNRNDQNKTTSTTENTEDTEKNEPKKYCRHSRADWIPACAGMTRGFFILGKSALFFVYVFLCVLCGGWFYLYLAPSREIILIAPAGRSCINLFNIQH